MATGGGAGGGGGVMAKLSQQQIASAARSLLQRSPDAVRYTEIVKTVHEATPDTPINSVHGGIGTFLRPSPQVVKVARGLYAWNKQSPTKMTRRNKRPPRVARPRSSKVKPVQARFVRRTSMLLRRRAEGSTWGSQRNDVLGGNALGGKWETPDVFGVLKAKKTDLVKFDPEIVAAEIKVSTAQTVVAFGQAIAYKLFSHKSYIAVPITTHVSRKSGCPAVK